MTTPAKLYGKDLSEYDEIDVDELLQKLSPEEINILAKEVDPDVSFRILGYVAFVKTLVCFRIHFYLLHKDVVMTVKRSPQDPSIENNLSNILIKRLLKLQINPK